MVARPGWRNVVPSGRTPSESHVVATQPWSPAMAPRARSSCMVKPRMVPHTLCHWAGMTLSMPSTKGATVPKATISGAHIRRPASKSTARTQVVQSRSHCRSGAIGSVAAVIAGSGRADQVSSAPEDRLGQEGGDDPVRRVDDLADLEVGRHRADHVRLLAAEPVVLHDLL